MTAPIRATEDDITILARTMNAEAGGQDPSGIGEVLVGEVVINRVLAGSKNPKNCTDFSPYPTIRQVVFAPKAFESTTKPTFYNPPRPETYEKAKSIISGGASQWPGQYALWFFRPKGDCPDNWYNQPFVGAFPEGASNKHCFYEPKGICEEVYYQGGGP